MEKQTDENFVNTQLCFKYQNKRHMVTENTLREKHSDVGKLHTARKLALYDHTKMKALNNI